MKKMLHIALGDHNTGLWAAMNRQFNTLHLDWTKYQNNSSRLRQEVVKAFTTFQPDIVFMQLQRENVIRPDLAQYMTSKAFTINWTGDVRHPIPYWFVELAPSIDITLFSNTHDVDQMKHRGLKSDYWQVGYDPKIFSPHVHRYENVTPEIVFLGSNYEFTQSRFPLSKLRYDMVEKMKKEFGNRFKAYGGNWDRLGFSEYIDNQTKEAVLYNSSKVAINLSHFNYGKYSSDRIFRLMGSGGFCLSHHYKDIESEFEVGHHLDTWKSIPELIEKTHYYLRNVYERERIRLNGVMHVQETGSWQKRMIELDELITKHNV
jgi:spore maturation protein CgeB